MSIEEPDADRLEQARPAVPDEVEDADELDSAELPLDADQLDVADQHRSVHFDDEEVDV